MAKRVVLAYSGGLDTSVAVRWMIEEWGVEVVARAGRRGPGLRRHARVSRTSEARAIVAGAIDCVVVDARHEMAKEFCAKAIVANAATRASIRWSRRCRARSSCVTSSTRPVDSMPRPWPTVAPARATTRSASKWEPTPSPRTSRFWRRRATGA